MAEDTIAAISTAVGTAGIGIVRISGRDAIKIADRIYVSGKKDKKLADQAPNTIHYGFVRDQNEIIDEVLVTLLRAPHSYTAEDTVEINCHGGAYALKKVLEAAIRNGARPAEPGEFTKRAFLNGRIDLSQAESVMDVIKAKNEYALESSVSQLQGSLSRKIRALRERILYQSAFIESALDDPEHYNLEGYSEVLKKETEEILAEVLKLIASADNGRLLKEGVQTVILGKPNAGKSTLLNVLAGEERAIVTEIAGTTRDTLEETISIGGITLNIVDTAGIRKTEDSVEKIGVGKAREKARTADLILYLVDSSTAMDENDERILDLLQGKKCIVLVNKSDLSPVTDAAGAEKFTGGRFPVIEISAREETGIDLLEETVKNMFYQGEISFNDQVILTNMRQKNALQRAEESLKNVLESISLGVPEDFFSVDLMDAYSALGEIIGEAVDEDLINEIFERFCMGK